MAIFKALFKLDGKCANALTGLGIQGLTVSEVKGFRPTEGVQTENLPRPPSMP